MKQKRTQGVVLSSQAFQDNDQILTIFTEDEGIIKLIAKGARAKKRGLPLMAISPLTFAEFIYKEQRSEIKLCEETSIIDLHLALRDDLKRLEEACQLLNAIRTSQLPGKPAPHLFLLFLRYLHEMKTSPDPKTLLASFLVKILIHEGVLHIGESCSHCQIPLTSGMINHGELLCPTCAPTVALFFDQDALTKLTLFAYSRSIKKISSQHIDDLLREKSLPYLNLLAKITTNLIT